MESEQYLLFIINEYKKKVCALRLFIYYYRV